MTIAKRLQQQANTCAQLAAATYDAESRERYLRLEQLYRHMLAHDGDEPETPFAMDSSNEPVAQRLS
ncbi:hypothetical protein ASD45_00775 [Pseudolabrys sp. Root1462]|uniref:hypothetical protein n=1 Tax=Pseudolabrys sp. Root1462 TaxID=1736466 RepID=UPI00070332C4|nr:hypothetical protein [Pseudolabrys sp. Root1462]KQY99495.1 hypothetical protein ASD45_00775 [Pseudolabrys sp. Root1462]